MWGNDYIKQDDAYTTFDGIVLGVIAGCVLWSALYLIWQMVQS
jgi:hypothetical protein